jgi:hypothetical protein
MSAASQGCGRVQRVIENGRPSWTVIGIDRQPVEPVEAFLRWLSDTERSPNTVRAAAALPGMTSTASATRSPPRCSTLASLNS